MTRRSPRIVLLGKQGAGKGTQAARLSEHYGISHLSTGQLFRDSAADGAPAGLEAKAYMDRGELVPDDIVVAVIEERFAQRSQIDGGFVLDGFPRTRRQAVELDRILDGAALDVVVNLDVPTEIVLDRIAGRRVCVECGTTYHVDMPPKVDWTCDVCGGDVVQRDDDTEAAVMRRLELYEQETVPIIDFYRQSERLAVVDGTGSGDDVFARLVATVDAARSEPVG